MCDAISDTMDGLETCDACDPDTCDKCRGSECTNGFGSGFWHNSEKAKARHGIPSHIDLCTLVCDENHVMTKAGALPSIRKFVAQFVRGTLSHDDMVSWIEAFDDWVEFDYGWVLIEKSLRFWEDYDGDDFDPGSITDEIVAIGTRSRTKRPLSAWKCL